MSGILEKMLEELGESEPMPTLEESKEDKSPKTVMRPCGVLQNIVFESITNDNHPAFLVYEPNTGFTFAKELHEDNLVLTPMGAEDIPYIPYFANKELIQSLREVSAQELFHKVFEEYETFLDLEKEYQWLEAIQTMETYQQHKLKSTSYLFHKGDWGSGKSRALEVHALLDYRPLYCDLPNIVNVYRYLGFHGKGNGTILQDEAEEIYDKDLLSIYRMGYRPNARYARMIPTFDGQYKQRFFEIFCCKEFAGRWLPKNIGFQQRCIEIPMVEGNPKKDEFEDEDLVRIGKLRLELLLWHMKSHKKPLPQIDTILKNRPKEIWKPKLQIQALVMPSELTNPILDFSLTALRETIEEKKSSLDAWTCKAVVQTINQQKNMEIPFSDLWNNLLVAVNAEVDDEGKTQTADYGELSKRTVGLKLGSIFGAKKRLVRNGGRVWRFDRQRLLKLMRKYGVEEQLWT